MHIHSQIIACTIEVVNIFFRQQIFRQYNEKKVKKITIEARKTCLNKIRYFDEKFSH